MGKGVSFALDFDHPADPDHLNEGVDDFLAGFRVSFDQSLPDDLSEPRDSCRRYTCGAAIKLLAQGGDGRVQPVDFCSAVLQALPDIGIPRRHCSKFNGIVKPAEPFARFLELILRALKIHKLTGPRLVGSVEHFLEQRTQSLLGKDFFGNRSGHKCIEHLSANLWATTG